MKLQGVYHVGIPVDNLDRAKEFYTKILGMEYLDRVGGNPNNPDALPDSRRRAETRPSALRQ